MARGSGWRQNAYRRGVSNGGPQARNRYERCERTRRSCCSRPAILTQKLHRHGGPWIPEKRITEIFTKDLRSVFSSGTLITDAFRVEISRAGSYSRRGRFHSPVDRRESGRPPAQTFREAL